MRLAPQLFGRDRASFGLDHLVRKTREGNQRTIRSLAANAYLGNDTSLCRVLGRYKMFVDAQDVGLSAHLILDGYWEMWVTEVIARRVRQGMVAVDIGANLGYFTLLMAERVGPQGRVHAFEPNPAIAERLRNNVAINGFDARVSVHQVALSNRNGDTVRLVVPKNDPKNAYMVSSAQPAQGATSRTPILTTRRVDSFAALAQVDFVKIDADTAEEAIWRGMSGLLQGRRPMTVVLEFTPARYADPQAFLGAITEHGFSLRLIDPDEGEQDATPARILSGDPAEDRMLLLCR